jgi:O-antigen ligase
MYGDSLQPIRVIALFFIPFVIINYLDSKDYRFLNIAYKFIFFLYLFIVFTILWTSDFQQGIKEIVYYLSHFSLFILILVFYAKANNPLKSLTKGWFVFIVLTLIIAFAEIFYDYHLSVSFMDADFQMHFNGGSVEKKFASVTFGNYNTYAMVLSMALPFLFGFLFLHKRYLTQLFAILVIVFSYFVLLINASRGGLIAGAIILIVWMVFAQKNKIHHLKAKFFILVPLALYALGNYMNFLFGQVSNRVSAGTSLDENRGRAKLFDSALDAFWEQPFFGSGIGSIQIEMELENVYIHLPHNLILEFLVQFGLLTTLIVCLAFLKMFIRIPQHSGFPKAILYSILLSFPIIFIINSTYLLHPITWVFLASLYCVSSFEKQNLNYD